MDTWDSATDMMEREMNDDGRGEERKRVFGVVNTKAMEFEAWRSSDSISFDCNSLTTG